MPTKSDSRRVRLSSALDELGVAVAVYSFKPAEIFRSEPLVILLALERDPQEVMAHASSLAACLIIRIRDETFTPADVTDIGSSEIKTGRTVYSLRASYLEADTLDHDPVVLIGVRQIGLSFPTESMLESLGGLSRREAQVALMLAQGASNKSIAQDIRVSRSTVRTHIEHAFLKLGVHSRIELVGALLRLADGQTR